MVEGQNSVVVYARPGCPYCSLLRRGLRRTGLQFTEVSIWDDPQAAAFVRSVADGNETVPTVVVGGATMVNPPVRRVLAAVAEHTPHLLPPQRPGARSGVLRWLRRG